MTHAELEMGSWHAERRVGQINQSGTRDRICHNQAKNGCGEK